MNRQLAAIKSKNSRVKELIQEASKVILDKEDKIELAMACLLAGGHLMIEDLPGIGKTTLAKTLALLLGFDFQRIQCTNDLLPGDILGVSVYDRRQGSFVFHPGPVFGQLVLVDEINRATPKTQSGLLEAMAEGQVSIDRESHLLPEPFFVIATQNPLEQAGTYPLPESQLDRFLMSLELDYPSRAAENSLLKGRDRKDLLGEFSPLFEPREIIDLQKTVLTVHPSEALVNYIQDILEFSRQSKYFLTGLSPRAGLALLRTSQSWSFLQGRDYILPEDVQVVLPWVVVHRLRLKEDQAGLTKNVTMANLFREVPVP